VKVKSQSDGNVSNLTSGNLNSCKHEGSLIIL